MAGAFPRNEEDFLVVEEEEEDLMGFLLVELIPMLGAFLDLRVVFFLTECMVEELIDAIVELFVLYENLERGCFVVLWRDGKDEKKFVRRKQFLEKASFYNIF